VSLQFHVERELGPFSYGASLDADRELVVLFGHSGAGKSLTLQFTAGLMQPGHGRIVVSGTTVFDSAAGIDLPPQQRRVGYVVQSLAVFPHMDVASNVAFGMEGGRADRQTRVRDLLELMGLEGYGDRMPRTLSGGQLQRVALARALGRDAKLLLLDEPFSALDESLRETMRRELLRLRADLGLTILFVTHDLREAHLLADRLAVFDQGRILQFDRRDDVFRRPASRRVAELTGVRNVFPGRLEGRREGGMARVAIDGCVLLAASVDPGARALSSGAAVDVAIRPERINLRRGPGGPPEPPNLLPASIVEDLGYGASHTLRMESDTGLPFEVDIAARPYEVLGVASQRRWLVEFPPEDLHVMPAIPR
jgi:ABC-type Fe3+/spermidine/putrescine transport system ATPase subunit